MRYPAYLKKNGTIGFVAPSFGCATEPYKSAFESALAAFHEMGYQTMLGPNCYAAEGIGISNTPQKCAAELQQMYEAPENNILLSCGGGELMCEILPYIDWEAIKKHRRNGLRAIRTIRISLFCRRQWQIQHPFMRHVRVHSA